MGLQPTETAVDGSSLAAGGSNQGQGGAAAAAAEVASEEAGVAGALAGEEGEGEGVKDGPAVEQDPGVAQLVSEACLVFGVLILLILIAKSQHQPGHGMQGLRARGFPLLRP